MRKRNCVILVCLCMISMTRGETLENKIYHARDFKGHWTESEEFASECVKIGQAVHEEVVGCGLIP